METFPIYKIQLGDAAGIQLMSLVEYPAVEVDFLKFSKEPEQLQFTLDEEKRIVFGCSLRTDFPIYRFDRRGSYYVLFDSDTVRQLSEKFLVEGKFAAVNLDHNEKVDGVHLIHSFIKDSKNGINPIGFEHIADGSWFTAYKVNNDDVWNRVKNGEFKGFSVEGFFNLEPVKEEQTLEKLIDDILYEK